ncbi:FGGY-family carbohydrate kinase [Prescottella defluvii]|uniref:FGGY-family carbohydrate kinase n=1 Tax=Prescottella defluvii TaxID=1323361 RepID=UPI0004F2FF6C|nr:FGGY-family carbohydrate kinase [Prescottella defluvii]
MGGVLGVSVGAGFVRLVRSDAPDGSGVFEHQAIEVGGQIAEDLAAQSVGVVLADAAGSGSAVGVGISYSDEAQAAALDMAMRRQGITGFRLVPEATAILEHLRGTDGASGFRTVVLYDLGSSGLTVSVVDRSTGAVAATERTGMLRGDDLVRLPRETFDSVAGPAVERSADLVAELIAQSGQRPDAVVLVGGGTHLPVVRDVLGWRLGLPVIAPHAPELATARGAALLATPVSVVGPAGPRPSRARGRHRRPVSRRQVSGAGIAGGALVVIAVIGFGLSYGRTLFGSDPAATADTTTSVPPSTSATAQASLPPTTPPAETPPPPDPGASQPIAGSGSAPASRPQVQSRPADPPRWWELPGLPSLPPIPQLEQLPQLPLPPVELPPLPRLPSIPGL